MKPSVRLMLSRLLFICALCLSSLVAEAHNSSKGLSAIKFQKFNDHTKAVLAVSFPDIDAALKFDKNKDDLVTKEEIEIVLGELKEIASKEIQVSFDNHKMTPKEITSLRQESNFEITFLYDDVPKPLVKYRTSLLARMSKAHQEFVTFADDKDTTLAEFVLTPTETEVEFSWPPTFASSVAANTNAAPATTSTPKPARRSTFTTFMMMGAEHIMFDSEEITTASGKRQIRYNITDHLLFLLALLIMCHSFMDVVKIITSFTIAHSITLGLAALSVVNAPPRIVEPLIAATIIYVGLENIFKLKTLQWRWAITFAFGLIHGFGFATAFKEMPGSGSSFLVRLLSFNLGVEVGQILIAAVILPIVWQFKKSPKFEKIFVPAASALVVALGVWWLVDRLRTGV